MTETEIDAFVDALPIQQQVRMVNRLFIAKPQTAQCAITRLLGTIAVISDCIPTKQRRGLTRALREVIDHVERPLLKVV